MNEARRFSVLAVPSSTSLRMVVVTATLLVSALFVGTALHNAFLGEEWQAAVLGCLQPGQLFASSPGQLACQAPAERRRAAIALLAVAIAVILAAGIIYAVPAVIRHRRRLVLADVRFSRAVDAVNGLALATRVHPPGVLIGPNAITEPFCLGRPGRHHVVLPRKLALLSNRALFDALVTHELGHLARRDVALSWLGRSLAFVLGPLLALPVLVELLRGEPGLAVDILWRGTVLLVVVLLVIRGLMRDREFDADLWAAQLPGLGHVLDVELSQRPDVGPRWRAALAWHPTNARRRAALADPGGAATLGFLDALPLGFLVTFATPVVGGIASALLFDTPTPAVVALPASLILGSLFGAALSLGLWRDAVECAGTGRRLGLPRVVVGVLAGGVLGQLASLAVVGAETSLLPVLPIALAGTTALIGGLSVLWVSGVDERSRPGPLWVCAALLGGLTAIATLWSAQQVELAWSGGWAVVAAWLTAPAAAVLPGVAAVVLGSTAGWRLRVERARSGLDGWPRNRVALVSGRGAVIVGLGAGVAGGLALAIHRLVDTPTGTDLDTVQRVDAALVAAGLVGAAVVVVLGLARGPIGVGAGLIAGPIAAMTTATCFLALIAVAGGNPLAATAHVLGGALTSGFLITTATAPLATIPAAPLRSTALLAVVALVIGAATAGGSFAGRAVLVPGLSALAEETLEVSRQDYRDVVARPLLEGRLAAAAWFRGLQAQQPPGPIAAARIRSELVPILQQQVDTAELVHSEDPRVQDVHTHAVTGARMQLLGFRTLADALEREDELLFRRADGIIAQSGEEWRQWAAGAQAL